MRFIITHKTLISMLFTALTLLGYISYKQLPVELYPNTQLPFLFIQVGSVLEVDPGYMENQAIIPIEGAIGTMKGVDKIESTADQQRGTIQITYKPGTNIKYAYLKLVQKIDELKKDLPSEFQVQVFKFDIEQINNQFMTLQVRGSGGVDRVRQVVDKEIFSKFQNINGIANVSVFGGKEKSIEVILNEEVCNSYGITPAAIRSAISGNSSSRTFSGKIIDNNRLTFINVVSEYSNVSDIESIIVKDSGRIQLRDVATVHFGTKLQDSYSRVNGKDAVTIQLTRDNQVNMIELANRTKLVISQLNSKLKGKDIEIVLQNNSAELMEKNIDLIINLAITGGLLAIFVLWIFLKNLRLVIAIAVAIPISVYTAFNLFYAAGISINSLTLLGMALAVGMLLDNSVVVMENIYRLTASGLDEDTAVIQGTREVWRSILASTLTTVMVFLPFAFSENFLIGLLGKNVGISIVSTLMVSLFVALLLVPIITHTFIKVKRKLKSLDLEMVSKRNRMIEIYFVILKQCMRYPARTVLGGLAAFFITLLISLGVSIISNEEPEITNFNLYVTLPGGTTLENTDIVVQGIEKKLGSLPENKDIISQVYEEEAVLTIELIKEFRSKRNYSVPKIKKEILEELQEFSQASFSWDPPLTGRRFGGGNQGGEADLEGLMGFGSQNEKIIVKGQDYNKILAHAHKIEYYLDQVSSVQNVIINIPSPRPEVSMNFNAQLMALYSIPFSSVLSELNSFPREFSTGVIFKQGTDEYDIIISTPSQEKEKERNLKDLKTLPVKGANNSEFELQNLAEFGFAEGLTSIKRINQEKQLEVSYSFIDEIKNDNDLLTAARLEVEGLLQGIRQPSGIATEIVPGEEDLSDFKFLILAAFILIFMIMASVFESFFTPVVLLLSIPLAGIGSLLLLAFSGNSLFNANTLTGFIILIGIVVNNGIILIDYSNILQKRGFGFSRSLMMAGLARVRPILITAGTTVIALIPLALGKAEYVTEIGTPFAITVIGGLTLSTLLTLVFIPTFNMGFQTALNWIRAQKGYIKLIQLVLCVGGLILIYKEVDSLVWQLVDYIVLITGIPTSFYFVQSSLRRAKSKIIDEEAPLKIIVRNLVKIYDRDSQFLREWKSGLKIAERKGQIRHYDKLKDFDFVIWKGALVAFVVYFIYFHLESALWFFILPVFLFLMIIDLLKPFANFAERKYKNNQKWKLRVFKIFNGIIYWFFPAFAMYIFYQKYRLIGLIIPFAILWYLALLVRNAAHKLEKEKVNINRIRGSFAGIQKVFYRFVMIIPVIGKKKSPFKALKGVSFEIENGMFGLLGPNGAGKSTLMKIICGILEPSYGQITINEIDVKEKREELQGLIGYLPQEFGMYENLTAYEFLHYMAILKKITDARIREERVNYVLQAVHMVEHKNGKIGSYSGGMKQRIGIAQILLHLPRILVVDEPTAGLDPRERIRFRNLLVELSRERIVIFSTHIIEDVASSCSKVAVIRSGELKYLGKPVEMAQIAEGKIWTLDLSIHEFEEFKKKYTVIHHMRNDEIIRVRCLSESRPAEVARQVNANLEDAYLYLLSDKIENGNFG
ncbi:MAG: efflux RND transporter permease subunit [Bacteroidales bacterium]